MYSISRPSTLRSLLLLPFLVALSLAQSVNLSEFQQINGFSAQCTKAYNTPIPNCTPNDFTANNACSQACIAGLEALTSLINTQCAGTSTSPNTLIGLFFEGKGVQALCPQVASASRTTQPQPPPSPAVSTAQQTTSQATSSTPSPSVISSSTGLAPSNTQKSQTTTPMATANPTQSTPPPNPSSSASLPSFTLSSPGTSTTAARSSSTSSTNSFGGSVDPFGGSASAASNFEIDRRFMATIIFAVVFFGWWL